jgi:hypothetical protein
VTVYSIKVDDVIKSHEFLSALMDVYREGGDRTVGSRIERTEEVEVPKPIAQRPISFALSRR